MPEFAQKAVQLPGCSPKTNAAREAAYPVECCGWQAYFVAIATL